jgi:hypothetical protein
MLVVYRFYKAYASPNSREYGERNSNYNAIFAFKNSRPNPKIEAAVLAQWFKILTLLSSPFPAFHLRAVRAGTSPVAGLTCQFAFDFGRV